MSLDYGLGTMTAATSFQVNIISLRSLLSVGMLIFLICVFFIIIIRIKYCIRMIEGTTWYTTTEGTYLKILRKSSYDIKIKDRNTLKSNDIGPSA